MLVAQAEEQFQWWVGGRPRAGVMRKAAIERFTKEFAPLVTSGPPGVTGYTTGRASVREVFAYWPTLVKKDVLRPEVALV
jgi:hypothetical protein